MKLIPGNLFNSHYLIPVLALIAAALVQPPQARATGVALATTPMATSTTTTVKPNLMFMLDDSGSMDWDFMPDTASNFAGKYGYNSSQCNGVAYNPSITYSAPVSSTGAPLNATATTFSAAYKDGFNTSSGTTDLNTDFTGGSGTGSSGISLTPGPAFYYVYSGVQTSGAQKDFNNSSSVFYKECNSTIGTTTAHDGTHPVNTLFAKFRLAAIPTTTITVTAAGGAQGATITVNSGISSRQSLGSIKVNGAEIMSSSSSRSSNPNTVATNVASKINNCTSSATGNCAGSGYSATTSSNVITIIGPAGAAGFTPAMTIGSNGSISNFSATSFPAASATTVSSITVNGTQLLSSNATGTTAATLATNIKNKISAAGYSAVVAGGIVTITAPSSASNALPAITVLSGTMTLTTEAFPESTPAKLQNFANWYSYYSTRMLMMKTGAGLAFNNVSDAYRVGFLSMNNNVPPGIVEVNTFDANQRSLWFSKLYASNPGSGTPLREALSHVGQYYAHKFGTITTYKATITVGGSGSTSVDSIGVHGIETMNDSSVPSASTSAVATNIANQINAMQVTDFGATASGSVVTLIGPATASGFTPVISNDGGGMTFTATSFAGTSTTSQLNGVTVADPIQYSCQQNFVILSTDGYWNGPSTYNLSNAAVGQQDGTASRPFSDGAQAQTTYTFTYTRNSYSKVSSTCTGSNKKLQTQPQIGSCSTTSSSGCTPTSWNNNGSATTSGSCASSGSITYPGGNSTSVAAQSDMATTVGTVGGVSDTLADVAMYYYNTDLRDGTVGNCTGALGTSVCEDNVFVSGSDNNLKQHMTTFTLGLGARGRMVYSTSYLTDSSGDYVSVKLGTTASSTVCTWQTAGTVCNWPLPSSGNIENIDDLWHAAVNGRGAYFSATDPTSLTNSLNNALTSIKSKVGSAAAAATSTLNPVAGNNFAYVASYTTLLWQGNLEARGINTDTGTVSENATWCVENVSAGTCASPGAIVSDTSGDTTAYFCVTSNSTVCPDGELDGSDCKVPVAVACTGTMNTKVADTTDSRTIKTANSTGTALINFDTAYRAANPTYFNAALLAGLSQWPASSDTSAAAVAFQANAPGDNLINYLRGQHGHEYDRSSVAVIDQFYRSRSAVLGDALESQPAYMGPPIFSYPYPGYTEFKTAQASRLGSVYMGTNDGMMHSFAADTGSERWAYVPSMVIPNMWRLADKQYRDLHTNYVNGSPITSDICTANCSNTYNAGTPSSNPVWKTIMVAGLNGGGRGYFALDITDPTNPILLWELTTTAGIGKVKDDDLGYTYGQPIITQKTDGTWVVLVTSGYDNGTDSALKNGASFIANSPAGSGIGYLYVLNAGTGAIISKISTGVGTAATPSGLAKISGYNAESSGNKVSYVYGGDLLGNLWRFDINSSTTATIGTGAVLKFATLFADSAASSPQPIMTTPQLGNILGKRVVFVGTGKYLEVSDLSTSQKQTQYAIKDDDATATLVNPRTTLVQQYLVNSTDGSATRVSSGSSSSVTTTNTVDFGTGRGWFVDLPDSRERVNIDSKLVLGTLLVPSIVPSSTECSPGGSGWLNFFDYQTGGAVIPPSGTAISSVKKDSTIVGINVLYIQGQPVVEVVTSTNPTPEKDPNVAFKATTAGFSGKRVLWRELVP